MQFYLNNFAFTLKIRLCWCKIAINYLLSLIFMLTFFLSLSDNFLSFLFSNILLNIINVASAIKRISVNEIRDFVFENYYKQIRFSKKTVIIQWNISNRCKYILLFVYKLKEKISGPCKTKECY